MFRILFSIGCAALVAIGGGAPARANDSANVGITNAISDAPDAALKTLGRAKRK